MKISTQRLKEIIKEELDEAAERSPDALKGFGTQTTTKSAQAKSGLQRSKDIAKGDTLGDVDNKERAMLMHIEKALTSIAEKDNLVKYRAVLQTVLQKLLAAADKTASKN